MGACGKWLSRRIGTKNGWRLLTTLLDHEPCVAAERLVSARILTLSMEQIRNLEQLAALDILTDERLNHRVEVETGVPRRVRSNYAGIFQTEKESVSKISQTKSLCYTNSVTKFE